MYLQRICVIKKKGGTFFNLIGVCNDAHVKAAPGMDLPIKSSSQERPRLVSNYASFAPLV